MVTGVLKRQHDLSVTERHRVRRIVQCSLMPTKRRRTLTRYIRTHIGLLSFVVSVAISAVLLAWLVFN